MSEFGLMLWIGVVAGWIITNKLVANKRPALLTLPAALLALLYAASCWISGDTVEEILLGGVVFFVLGFALLAFTASRRGVWGYVLALLFGTAALFTGVPLACSLLLGGK